MRYFPCFIKVIFSYRTNHRANAVLLLEAIESAHCTDSKLRRPKSYPAHDGLFLFAVWQRQTWVQQVLVVKGSEIRERTACSVEACAQHHGGRIPIGNKCPADHDWKQQGHGSDRFAIDANKRWIGRFEFINDVPFHVSVGKWLARNGFVQEVAQRPPTFFYGVHQ